MGTLLQRILAAGRAEQSRDSQVDDASLLPPLPRVDEALEATPKCAALLRRAKACLDRLQQWETAFRRQSGAAPTDEQKAGSSVYSHWRQRYEGYLADIAELVADQEGGEFIPPLVETLQTMASEVAQLRAGSPTPETGAAATGASSGRSGAGSSALELDAAVTPRTAAAAAEYYAARGVGAQPGSPEAAAALQLVIPKPAAAVRALLAAAERCPLFRGLPFERRRAALDATYEVHALPGR